MYPLGVLFGLGFDTSSEVALLAIASVQGAKGTSIWIILIFPLLFTGRLESGSFYSLALSNFFLKQECVSLTRLTALS